SGDVYQFIVNDLVYASENLPVTSADWEVGRVTTWSAQGLLAKVYLSWSGLDQNGTRDQTLLNAAKEIAGNVCNNSGLTLMTNYADVFKYENSDNKESLFALQWSTTGGGWYGGNMLQLFSGALLINGQGGFFAIEVTHNMYLQYTEADLRRKATFMYKGDEYPELNTNKGGLTFSGHSGLKKHIIGNEVDLNLSLITNTASPEHTILLRLADIYLVYAEAILGNNATTTDAEALNYFNAVRTRAGLDPVESIDADLLRKERRIELAAEGEYWFDLVRLSYYNPSKAMGLLNGAERVKIQIDDDGVVTPGDPYGVITPATANSFRLPIPSSEITANPKLLDNAVPFFD
nr:RagB/SusD family nutrient uptake outer membrane protein [Sunxiuqinia sp.]